VDGFNIAEVAAIVGIFAAASTVLQVLGRWLESYLNLHGAAQDIDRAGIKTQIDKHEATLENWYKELHARISREQDVRQAADKELLLGIHRLEVEMAEKFATKGDLLASEARVIDAFNRNMDRREQRRGGQQ
jgi:hypothetical protein